MDINTEYGGNLSSKMKKIEDGYKHTIWGQLNSKMKSLKMDINTQYGGSFSSK
jgi:uncharacterized alkaline shock family protein YloU